MVRRGVTVVLALAMAMGGWALAGEGGKPKRAERKRPEPVSTDAYVAAVDELMQTAAALEGPEGGAKLDELKASAKAALAKMQVTGVRAERFLAADDAKALAATLQRYASASLTGKLSYERRQFIQSKPELAEGYKQLQEKEKQIREEREAFYQKLRPLSPDIDKLEKKREDIQAAIDAKRKAEADRRKAEQEKRRKDRPARKKKEA